jgi:hypothetical protein
MCGGDQQKGAMFQLFVAGSVGAAESSLQAPQVLHTIRSERLLMEHLD